MRSRSFACVRARLHPRDVFSRRPTDYRPVASAKTRQLSAVAVVAFPLRHMLLSTNRAHSIGQHNTVFAHLIVSCVGCRVPYACLRFVCGACNTIITCRSGEMGRGWAFHGPPPSRHSLSSGVCTHSRAPGAALRQRYVFSRCDNLLRLLRRHTDIKLPRQDHAFVLLHGWSRPVFYDVSCVRALLLPRH